MHTVLANLAVCLSLITQDAQNRFVNATPFRFLNYAHMDALFAVVEGRYSSRHWKWPVDGKAKNEEVLSIWLLRNY